MKKKLLIIFILTNFLLVSAQKNISNKTIRVSYIKAYKNYRDKSNKPPRLMKNLEYGLLCSPNAARFEYISGMNIDDDRNNRFIGNGGGKGVYYRNLKQNLKLHQTTNPLNDKKYLIKENLNKYKWKLLKESKKILGYTCYKAIAKVNKYNPFLKKQHNISTFTVWYTPSIPLPFGPAGYDGVPGLVLEASRSSFYFIAQKIEFLDKKLPIKKPVKGIIVSQKEFEDNLIKSFISKNGKIK